MMCSSSPSIFIVTFVTFLLQLSWFNLVTEAYILTHGITTTWNNQPLKPSEYVNVSFFPVPGDRGLLGVYVRAPYYNDPDPPAPVGRFESLWEYEVVQVFFLGEHDCYLELMFGPKGHYVAYYLEGVRNVVNKTLDLRSYSASIDGKVWSGRALIPTDYFPPLLDKFNAFAIHGKNDSRQHLALFPATKDTADGPDFHKMQFFQPLNLTNWISIRSSKFKNNERRSTSSVGGLDMNFSIFVVQTIVIFFMATFYA